MTIELAKSEILDHLPPSMPYADLNPVERGILAAAILHDRGDERSRVFAGQLLIGRPATFQVVDDLPR